MNDRLLLLLGAALLYVPGVLVILACRARRWPVLLAGAPAVSIAVLQLAALLRYLVGGSLVVVTGGVLAVLAAVTLFLELRARGQAVSVHMARSAWAAVRRAPLAHGVAVVLLGAAAWLGLESWLRGFGGLSSPPQEHDTVMHTLLTAFITYTGHASPFEVMPMDLASGGQVTFYPAGAHTVAGVLGMAADPVRGLNATTALVLGLVAPVTLFGALAAVEPLRSRPVFAALGALVSVTLYRPYFELSHDAGILALAMGLALVPAIVGVLAGLGRRDVGTSVILALAALGVFTVHSSVPIVIVIVLAIMTVVAALSSAEFRAWLRQRLGSLGLTGVLTAVLAAPWVLAARAVVSSVGGYPEAPPVAPLGFVLKQVGLFNYGGFLEAGTPLYQVGVAVLFWIGFVGCVTSRRLWPLAAAWLFWGAAAVLYASGHAGLPVLAQVAALFYNSWTRIRAVGWLLAPAVTALGMAVLANRIAGWPVLSRRRLTSVAATAMAAAVAAGYLLTFGIGYVKVNSHSVADRYGRPTFQRVTAAERDAFQYLAQHRGEVGRVLNNGNDGSTFLYVDTGIPVVNVYPLGMPNTRYGIYLMEHFDEIGTDPAVRCLVQRYHITHVIVSASSPPIPAFAAPDHWVGTPMFSYAPGLSELDAVPQVERVYVNQDASVYRIDPAIVSGRGDLGACTADPAEPLTDAGR